jgi:hypothetical protein
MKLFVAFLQKYWFGGPFLPRQQRTTEDNRTTTEDNIGQHRTTKDNRGQQRTTEDNRTTVKTGSLTNIGAPNVAMLQ